MRYSQLFLPTKRSASADAVNANLLTRAGFVSQTAAGIYAFLPLGLKSIHKIEQIVREEMNSLGGNEVALSALQLKSTWEKSGRWTDKNFRSILYYDAEADIALAPTHEEPMTQLVKEAVQSYRDLPVLLYQFQTKFRKELRAKSGLLRGREFRMKDLYSFHPDEKSHLEFYERVAVAYRQAFDRLGLETYRVKASGGIFSDQFSDEFQVVCPSGEDEILVNTKERTGYNHEIESQLSAKEKDGLERVQAIEVGNIFHLGTKYPEAFGVQYLDKAGQRQPIWMGAYGIGISRLLGTLAEIYHDENGLRLPQAVSPYHIHLIDLTKEEKGAELEKSLVAKGYEVLFDDRDLSVGQKLADADLIGLPIRLLYSPKTAEQAEIELKHRDKGQPERVKLADLETALRHIFS